MPNRPIRTPPGEPSPLRSLHALPLPEAFPRGPPGMLRLVKPPKGQIGLNALVPSKQGPQAFAQENRLTGSPRTGFLDVSLEKSYETETCLNFKQGI